MKFVLPDKKYTFAVIGLFILLVISTFIFGKSNNYKYMYLVWLTALVILINRFGYRGFRPWFDKYMGITMALSFLVLAALLKFNLPVEIQNNAFKLSFAVYLTGDAILKQIGVPPDKN